VCSTNSVSNKSECLPKCKDGFLLEGEVCDAGSDPLEDGCTDDCKGVKTDWLCEGGDPETASKCVN